MAKATLLNTRSLFASATKKDAHNSLQLRKKSALKKPPSSKLTATAAAAAATATGSAGRRKAALPTNSLTLYRIEMPTPLGDFWVYSDESGAVRACNWTDGEADAQATLRSRWYPHTSLRIVDPRASSVSPAEEEALRHCATKVEGLRRFFAADTATVAPAELQRHLDEVCVSFPPQTAAYTRQVWETLMREVPAGNATTYGDLAHLVNPTAPAPRAVGRAMATNPVCVLMPCHRVLGSTGATRGYGCGLYRKVWLLRHERAPASELKLQAVERETEVHTRVSYR